MIKILIKEYAKKSVTARRFARWYFSKARYFDWNNILDKDRALWGNALRSAKGKIKFLIATSIGAHIASTNLESVLAVALTIRNAEVHLLLCDEVLPACMACEIDDHRKNASFARQDIARCLCSTCFPPAYKTYKSLNLPVHRFSKFLTTKDIEAAESLSSTTPFEEISQYSFDDISVGEHALAGALRFFARGDLKDEPCGEKVLRQYFKASLLSTFSIIRLLEKYNFSSAIFNHGIYVPQGLIGEVCRKKQVHVVNWNPAYRKKCFIFSHNNTYHHTMLTEPVEKWTEITWDDQREKELIQYLKSRWNGTQDWIWFHEKPCFDLRKISKETGIDFSKPCIGMLTSVMWDAVLHYPSNAFSSMLEWINKTIEYFSHRPDLQLIIRVHPAEIRGTLPSRQRVGEEVRKVFPELPKNVFIIPPESAISTYRLMENCNTVIIYNTKTGAELAASGIPILVAGEAWIRNKGFAFSVDTQARYFDILDKLPLEQRMTKEQIVKARKYAYHFFFRRMIPIEFMRPTGGIPPYKINIKSLEDLMPKQDKGLDTICDGIMNKSDFIYS